jgi:hypothetical protein
MEKEYQTPSVRVMDLRYDAAFCLSDPVSGSLEKTYDDELEF